MTESTEILDRAALGRLIRTRGRELGLTQEELAGFVGIGRRLVIEIEAGTRDAKIDSVLGILGALGLEIEIRPRRLG